MKEFLDNLFFGEGEERVKKAAALELIQRHREEYDELTGRAAEMRAEQLQREINDAVRELAHLRSMNPDGINVPALTGTANQLAAENDELRVSIAGLTRRADKLAKENTKLRDMLAESKPKEEVA